MESPPPPEPDANADDVKPAAATAVKKKIVKRGTRPEVAPSVQFNCFGFGNMNDDINTPAALFAILHARFAFAFDPFPSSANRPPNFDGFTDEWRSPAFCNPPYSCIEHALDKALAEMRSARRVRSVFLIPFRPNNKYWTRLVWPNACELWSFEGRMCFEGYAKASPMPMSLVVLDPDRPGLGAPGVLSRVTYVREGAYAWWQAVHAGEMG